MTLHCVNGRCGSLGTLARSPDGLGDYFATPPWAGAYRDGALGAIPSLESIPEYQLCVKKGKVMFGANPAAYATWKIKCRNYWANKLQQQFVGSQRRRRAGGTSGCAACAGLGAYGEGCNPSAMPDPDEQVILGQIAAKQAEKLVKLSQCDLLTGPAVGGCKSGVSSGYEGEIARLRNDLAALCAAKTAGLVQTWAEDEQTAPAPGSGALDGKLPYILGGVGLLAVVGIGLYIGRKKR